MVTGRRGMSMQREVLLQVMLRLEIRNSKTNKLCQNYDANPCEVVDRKGGEVTVRSTAGAAIKKNVSFVKKYQEKPLEAKIDVEPVRPQQEGTNQAGVAKGKN